MDVSGVTSPLIAGVASFLGVVVAQRMTGRRELRLLKAELQMNTLIALQDAIYQAYESAARHGTLIARGRPADTVARNASVFQRRASRVLLLHARVGVPNPLARTVGEAVEALRKVFSANNIKDYRRLINKAYPVCNDAIYRAGWVIGELK